MLVSVKVAVPDVSPADELVDATWKITMLRVATDLWRLVLWLVVSPTLVAYLLDVALSHPLFAADGRNWWHFGYLTDHFFFLEITRCCEVRLCDFNSSRLCDFNSSCFPFHWRPWTRNGLLALHALPSTVNSLSRLCLRASCKSCRPLFSIGWLSLKMSSAAKLNDSWWMRMKKLQMQSSISTKCPCNIRPATKKHTPSATRKVLLHFPIVATRLICWGNLGYNALEASFFSAESVITDNSALVSFIFYWPTVGLL